MEQLDTLIPTLIEEWKKYTILIVDDEPSVLAQLHAELKLSGFSVVTAPSGEDGLRVLEQVPAKLVISDQKMAPGISGTQFLAEVKNKYPDIPTMILSAFSEIEYVMEAMNQARAHNYLLKPWSKQQLIETVSLALQFYHNQSERRRLAEANVQLLKKMARVENLSVLGEFAHTIYERFIPVLKALYLDASRWSEQQRQHGLHRWMVADVDKNRKLNLLVTLHLLGRFGAYQFDAVNYASASILPLVQEAAHLATTAVEASIIEGEIIEDYPSELPPLLLHQEPLFFAVQAVIENAILFNPNTEVRKAKIRVTLEQQQTEKIRIDIQDNGPGIEWADRERVFHPLYTTCRQASEPDGALPDLGKYNLGPLSHVGLGLPMARWYITQHDGSLELINPGNPGCLFRIEIPTAQSDLREQLGF